jgi:ribose transport system permease protein
MCGVITAFAGVLYSSLNGPSLTFGDGLLLPAYAAAFLGFTQIHPGRFNVWGTVIAVYVLAAGVRGLSYVTSVQWLNSLFNGVAVIAAVAFAVWRQRVQTQKQASEETALPVDPPTPGGLPSESEARSNVQAV